MIKLGGSFGPNTAIRLICAAWFLSMVMIGGAGRVLLHAGGVVWHVLVPPEAIRAMVPQQPERPISAVHVLTVEADAAAQRAQKDGWGPGQALTGTEQDVPGEGTVP